MTGRSTKMKKGKYHIRKTELRELLSSSTYCSLRADLRPQSENNPPTSAGFLKVVWTTDRQCIQPDRLDDQEFNMFVRINDGLIVAVNSIDFEFEAYN